MFGPEFYFFFLFSLYSFCYSFAFIWLTICNQKSVDDGWPFAFDTSILTPKNMKKMKKARLKLRILFAVEQSKERRKNNNKSWPFNVHTTIYWMNKLNEWHHWVQLQFSISFSFAFAFTSTFFAQISLGSVS